MAKAGGLLCGAALGLWLAPAAPALAQAARIVEPDASAIQLGEVIVTAERRSSNIQKTPIAITAVAATRLDKSFITDVAGLNGVVPSLETTRTSGFETIVTIRGVGSETPENDLTTVPGVSLFADGVYLVNTISLEQTLFDIDRIEVLRGPQGALYGQSSIGGAINILTNQPRLGAYSGQGDVSVGTYDLTRERAEANLPIGDTVAIRLSAQRFDHQGFTRDLAIPGFREDDAHNTALKAAILWRPIDSFSATLAGQWYSAKEHGEAQKNLADPEPGAWEIYQDYPSRNDLTTQLYHLNLQYDLGAFSLRSVSAYQGMRSTLEEDSSRSAVSLIASYDDVAGWDTTLRNYTEEFDILSAPGGRVDWIVGAFLLGQTSRQFVAEFEGGDTPHPTTAILPDIETNPPGNLAYGNDSRVSRQSYSAFAQATWRLAPTLRLTAGGRINLDRYADASNNFSAFGTCLAGPLHGAANCADNETSDHVPTWRVELEHDLAPDDLVYVSAARGYKPGGVNGNNTAVVVPFTFAPETNTAFEVGSKNLFLDRTLRLNAAAFYYFYNDMQYIEFDPFPFASGISNIPRVHIYGVEGEASYVALGDRLHIDANLALEQGHVAGDYSSIDSTVANAIERQGPPSPCGFGGGYVPACQGLVIAAAKDLKGDVPPAMPNVSGSIAAAYRIDTPAGALTPRVEIVYRGAEWARIFNEPTLDRVPAYTTTNLNLEFLPNRSRLTVDLAATNVFNVAGINSQYTDPFGTGQTSRQYIPPRQVILTLGYSF